jgi:hypothetical protein
MQGKEHPKLMLFYMIALIVAVAIALVFLTLYLTPYADYSTTNSTTDFWGTKYKLSFDSIPTIINGVTASTSIISGFTGAIIGIFYRKFKDEGAQDLLFICAFYILIPMSFLFTSYHFLVIGYVDFATKIAFSALLLSILNLAIVMLGSRLLRSASLLQTNTATQMPDQSTWKIKIKNGENEREVIGRNAEAVRRMLDFLKKEYPIQPLNQENSQELVQQSISKPKNTSAQQDKSKDESPKIADSQPERRTKRSELLIGVFIGIYGNWLIALVEKFGTNVEGYSLIPFTLSFLFLIWYFREIFSRTGHSFRFLRRADVLGYVYILLVSISLLLYNKLNGDYYFIGIGAFLWIALMQSEKFSWAE